MKLIRAQVQNYRSVKDSGEFKIGQLTCSGTCRQAMTSMNDMKEFIEYMNDEVNRSANMDWSKKGSA